MNQAEMAGTHLVVLLNFARYSFPEIIFLYLGVDVLGFQNLKFDTSKLKKL